MGAKVWELQGLWEPGELPGHLHASNETKMNCQLATGWLSCPGRGALFSWWDLSGTDFEGGIHKVGCWVGEPMSWKG